MLPGPYGAAVGAIGAAVSGVDTIIQAAATGSTNPNASIEGAVTVDDEDAFEITPQYCINTAGSEPKDILTSPDSEWVSMPAVRVRVNSPSAVSLRARAKFSDDPVLYARMQAHLQALAASAASLENPFQIQQRAKIVFVKGCTLEQAKNYSATLRLGSQV